MTEISSGSLHKFIIFGRVGAFLLVELAGFHCEDWPIAIVRVGGRMRCFHNLCIIYGAIEELPAEYRTLLRMSFEEGLKNAEIAQRLGVAEITVKKRKAKMLEILRSKLGGNVDMVMLTFVLSDMIHA